MHAIRFSALSLVLLFSLGGCQSHQAKLDALQKEHEQLGAQFQKDCFAEYLKVPPTLSAKCADEKSKLEAVGRQLQDERLKE